MDSKKVRSVDSQFSNSVASIDYSILLILFFSPKQEGVLVVRRSQDNFVLEDEKNHFELLCMDHFHILCSSIFIFSSIIECHIAL